MHIFYARIFCFILLDTAYGYYWRYVKAYMRWEAMRISELNSENLTDEIIDRLLFNRLEDKGEVGDYTVLVPKPH